MEVVQKRHFIPTSDPSNQWPVGPVNSSHFTLQFIIQNELLKYTKIFANDDGPRDAASCNINHIAVATEYNYQAKMVNSKLYTDREISVI